MGKRKDSGVQISLFPFLSILAALIGALVVIIAAMAIAELNKAEGQEPEEVDRAKENKIVIAESEELGKEAAKLREILERITLINQELTKMTSSKELLRSLIENAEKNDVFRDELRQKLAVLQKENKTLTADIEQLLAELEKLKKELAERKKPIDDRPAIQIRPSGSARGKKAYFVEISNKTVIIHRKSEEPMQIPAATVSTNEDFIKLLEHVDSQAYRTLTFLIRGTPESIATYNAVGQVVNAWASTKATRDFRVGKMPIAGEGKIDLGVFAEFME